MLRGFVAAILGALAVALIIVGIAYLLFTGLLIWLGAIILGGILAGFIILFIIIFVIALIAFFALFYYMAEKKPTVEPGNYKLGEEKGKNE